MSIPVRSSRPLVIACSLALAEAFSGTACTEYAQMLLTGRIDAWSGYWDLPEEDRQRVTDLLRHRTHELASSEVFHRAVHELTTEDALDGYRQHDDMIHPVHGLPPRKHADRLLTALAGIRRDSTQRLDQARPGRYHTTLRKALLGNVRTSVNVVYNLTDLTHQRSPAFQVSDAPRLDAVEISLDDLRKTAARIDAARDENHRLVRVNEIFLRLADAEGRSVTDVFRIMSGGMVQPLQAPTGFGKSVLLEVLGTLAIEKGVPSALVVPSRAAVLALARQIEENLFLLGVPGSCTPLLSPSRVMDDAEKAAKDSPGGFGSWAYDRLSYGCALAASAETDESIDGWNPGAEPCRELYEIRRNGERGRRHACPWWNSCGKFRLMRDALTADVIVTAHQTFFSGQMHLPLATVQATSDHVSVEEFLMRRCQLVIIDELDQFQDSVIGRSARHLMLAEGRRDTPIHRLDDEFRGVFGNVPPQADGEVRAILSDLRLLSENHTANLAKGWLPPVRVMRRGYRLDHWIVPRGHDAWITARLLGLDPTGRKVTADEVEALQQLYGAPAARSVPPLPLANLREETVSEAQARITALLAGIASGCRHETLLTYKIRLSECLHPVVSDDTLRGDLVDHMVRRAHLEPLRRKLSELFFHTAHLRTVGADSAESIADALGGSISWQAMPASPLGRLFLAFKERFDADRPEEAKLSVAAFGGDPHGYVRYLGELTARAHARVPRAVLGLSATSYFPGAPHHHVLTQPAWTVADADTTGVTIHDARVFSTGQTAIRVSGVQGRQREINTGEISEGLYRLKLTSHLVRLKERRDGTGRPGRDRILVVTTSYDSVLSIAEGMVRAGAPQGSLCLLTRPGTEPAIRDPRWQVLASDRVERFPATGADILIAPLAVVERGVNILDGGVSALGAIYVMVRPVPILDEPEELLAHISHRLWEDVIKHEPHADAPLDVLDRRMRQAGRYFEEIARSPQYFRSLPVWVQLGVVAEIIVGLIQLVGRARRGGTPGEIYLVDDAFFDPSGRADLPALIIELRERWRKNHQLDRLLHLYGPTLQSFFDFAERTHRMSDTISPGEQP